MSGSGPDDDTSDPRTTATPAAGPADPPPDDTGEAAADRRSLPLLHLLPNLVTLLGLCAGLTSIRYVLDGRYEIAAGLIVLAAIMDGMDGLVARRLNAASHFGAELDSLSDFVCFGVAPGVFIYHFALTDLPGMGWLAVLLYILCACLRLARFNVMRNAPPPPGRAHFVGVPAPAGAMLALLPVYMTLAGWVDLRAFSAPIAVYLAIVGLLMISRLPTLALKGLRVPRNRAVFVMLGVAVFAGFAVVRPWALLALADLAYLAVIAQAAWVHRRRLA
ncbi:CDP-diacylglycerol--serine O-phosphatidyltransferase [Pararhodobacter sp. SW119]|uniref:CDP-diacylglycerol--serine O-phosphatidyltransferase n=1 Tax=Pararhodobacter sp. SW119 TaxID=2780075 RepID=UPI001ADFACD8|nr:CDP-diacylglycerol--serine O-phosphatidyltransferase [Pararhodobacter sp. SW119]